MTENLHVSRVLTYHAPSSSLIYFFLITFRSFASKSHVIDVIEAVNGKPYAEWGIDIVK